MKIVEVELTDETYESLCREAEEKRLTVGEIVRARIEPLEPWRLTPVDMGGDFLFPPERWRDLPGEDRVA